jgi:quercetin dioxygenase-like cupin family protein
MAAQSPPYRVRSVEELFRSDQFLVRRFTLGPGESIPWHDHPKTNDDYYMLSGSLTISLRQPEETLTLAPGQTYRIVARRPHHNSNTASEPCVFLLIQGPGPSVFNVTRSTQR